jgi:hypothetical protein
MHESQQIPSIQKRLKNPMLTLLVDQVALNPNVTTNTSDALATYPDLTLGTFDMDAPRAAQSGSLACDIVGWRMPRANQPLCQTGMKAPCYGVLDHSTVTWKERPDFKRKVLINTK